MSLTPWQRTNILGAVTYLKHIGGIAQNTQAMVLADGLLEVLEPSRRTVRLQREAARAASAGAQAGRERRTGRERRATTDRRQQQLPFEGPDRRGGGDRRADRRRNA